MTYADYKYYVECYKGEQLSPEEGCKALRTASDTIDTLTFCRIDWECLTTFQKSIIKDCCCQLAEWQTENSDILTNPYSSYSINGVSASWGGSATVETVNGVMIPKSIYAALIKTGLCHRGIW